MLPAEALKTFIAFLRGDAGVTAFDAIKAALTIATYAVDQFGPTTPEEGMIAMKAAPPLSKAALATELEKASKVSGAAAASINWKGILAAIIKLLPMIFAA